MDNDGKSCIICFTDIHNSNNSNSSEDDNENVYSCSNPDCSALICEICLEHLINYSKKEKQIPTCPNNTCNSYYIKSNIENLSKEQKKNYNKACMYFMIKEHGDEIDKKKQEKKIIEKIRKERMEFIKTTYPAAISLVAQLTFSNKLRALEKEKQKDIEKKMKKSNRKCMVSICSGNLDSEMRCMICNTKFCKKCEKIYEPKHKCDEGDVESLKFIQSLVKCPGCLLPVFKNQGCNSITCSNCNTNFEYTTGKVGGHGSLNKKIVIQDKEKISTILKNYFTEIDEKTEKLILEIDILQPKKIGENTLLKPIKDYLETKDMRINGRILSKKLDLYVKNKYDIKNYFRTISELESNVMKKKLTVKKLEKTINEIKN